MSLYAYGLEKLGIKIMTLFLIHVPKKNPVPVIQYLPYDKLSIKKMIKWFLEGKTLKNFDFHEKDPEIKKMEKSQLTTFSI